MSHYSAHLAAPIGWSEKAWSLRETMAAMRSDAGKHLDPDLLEVFLAGMPSIREIHYRFSEQHQRDPLDGSGLWDPRGFRFS